VSDTGVGRAQDASMASPARPGSARLVVLLLVVVLAAGLAATVTSAASLPPCRVADVTTKHRAYSDWQRTLLDTTYRLTSGYRPNDLRSTATAGLNGGHKVRSLMLKDLKAMVRAARSAGARLAVQSAYRSYSTQASTFAYWVRVSGYASAIKASARAGHSEHQLGTTIDFRSYGGSAPWNYRDWGTSRAGKWMRTNAWRYGFVMSYPKGKTGVTCYIYEPWHFRYVGRSTAAAVRASGLTLREYLWRRQSNPTPSPTPPSSPVPSATPVEPSSEPSPSAPPSEPPPSEPPSDEPSPAAS
jgi:D-alanyl-D-alanine carboxypeptidase